MSPLALALAAPPLLLGLTCALALEAWIIRRDRTAAREPVEGMAGLLLRAAPLPRSCVRVYLGLVSLWAVVPVFGHPAPALLALLAAFGFPSVDRRLGRLRSGRGPGGRREPRPLPSRTLADRRRRGVGAVLTAALAAGTAVLAAATDGGWWPVAAVVALAAAGSAVAQGFLVPRIVLDGTHLYLYGVRWTTVVPVERVAGVEPGERGVTVRLADGTVAASSAWARTPGRARWTADRVRGFVVRARPAAGGTEGRAIGRERAFPVSLFLAWTVLGLAALALL